MTTPEERTRSVIQTREFLSWLQDRTDIPIDIRTEANRLLRHYPSDANRSISAQVIPSLWAIPAKDSVKMQE
jgi:hypothetical protein